MCVRWWCVQVLFKIVDSEHHLTRVNENEMWHVPKACRTICRSSFSISTHPIPAIISDGTICAPYSHFAIRRTKTEKSNWMLSSDCDSPAPVHGCRPILSVAIKVEIFLHYWQTAHASLDQIEAVLTSGNWYFSLMDLCRWSSLMCSSLPLKYLTNT